MSAKIPLSDAVRRAVDQSFAEADRQTVLDALAAIGSQWTREALLILANGDVGRFLKLVEWDQFDWREIPVRLQGSRDGISEDELIRRRTALGLSLVRGGYEAYAEHLRERVLRFVAAKLLWPVERLTGQTRLQDDLGLAGSDGRKFIMAFGAEFALDLREFKPEAYFAPKPWDRSLWELVAQWFKSATPPVIQITVDDLIRVAESRCWKALDAS